jgi:hypothetical protein
MRDLRDDYLRGVFGLLDHPELTASEIILCGWLALNLMLFSGAAKAGSRAAAAVHVWQILLDRHIDTLPPEWRLTTAARLMEQKLVERVANLLWTSWAFDRLPSEAA